MEKVDEMRLETILPATRRAGVLSALIKAHPYEEVAYDLYPLDLDGKKVGLGLLINSGQSFSLEIFNAVLPGESNRMQPAWYRLRKK
jgi:hypothetical protein